MHVQDAQKLLCFFWPEFVAHDGCVLLASEVSQPLESLATNKGLTALEAFRNHVHIFDKLRHNAGRDSADTELGFYDSSHPDFVAAVEIGKHVAAMWCAKLKLDFPGRQFRVYLTMDDNPVVRFHTVRANEPPWLDEIKSADAISRGRIVIWDTRSS
jgi:hypothetical protein